MIEIILAPYPPLFNYLHLQEELYYIILLLRFLICKIWCCLIEESLYAMHATLYQSQTLRSIFVCAIVYIFICISKYQCIYFRWFTIYFIHNLFRLNSLDFHISYKSNFHSQLTLLRATLRYRCTGFLSLWTFYTHAINPISIRSCLYK